MHQSLVPTPGTCQLLQTAPMLTDLAQCYFPIYFPMWKVCGAGGQLKNQQRCLVEVMSSFKCYITAIIPCVTHINGLTEQHSMMDLKTEDANLSISMTDEPLENVNICLEGLHVNSHVSSNLFYIFVGITAQNTSQHFSSLIQSALLLSGRGQFSVS
ncbi:uncharacterized [Tachysurus ichikawai]